jgi:hypothetical protein
MLFYLYIRNLNKNYSNLSLCRLCCISLLLIIFHFFSLGSRSFFLGMKYFVLEFEKMRHKWYNCSISFVSLVFLVCPISFCVELPSRFLFVVFRLCRILFHLLFG